MKTFILPLLLLSILFGFHTNTKAQPCLASDSLALVELYNANGGANWTNSWELTDPVSTWYGVTVTGCGVTCLDLDGYVDCTLNHNNVGNNLVGDLVDLNLPDLQSLWLSKNQLTSVSDFSNLDNLTSLDLDNNQLTTVPDFSNLNNLTTLHLGNNELATVPDFSNLDDLTTLHLDNNELATVPDFSNLDNLTTLYLDNNELATVSDFSNLDNLISLNLDNNQLTTVPDFSNLDNLRSLYLDYNELTTVPDFSNLDNLTSLRLSNNELTTVSDFSNLYNLINLDLSNNELTMVPDFSNLYNLAYFPLSKNQLTTVPDFSNLYNLTWLYLSFNELTTVPDFSNLYNLTTLHLRNNQLTTVPNFSNLDNLFWLSLGNNQLNFTDPLPLITIPSYSYAPQGNIAPLQSTPSTIYTIAGGNINDNTYTWYKNDKPQDTILADSTFTISGPGLYRCEVTNVNLPYLTLNTKEINICGTNLNASDFLFPAYNASSPVCTNQALSFNVYDFGFNANYDRYIFSWNGKPLQDSTLNTFTADFLQNGDIISCMVYDATGCNYLTNSLTVNAYEAPEISLCNPTTDKLQVSLTQGDAPWSFDLLAYEGLDLLSTTTYTVYALDTNLTKSPNVRYEVSNLSLSSDACSYPEVYPTGQIEGCTAICAGYGASYTERYVARFPSAVSSVAWSVIPLDAVPNGAVAIVGDTAGMVLEVDFSNANSSYDTIRLQAVAMTDCGTEVLEYQIVLDKDCVWPGDVNRDGQVVYNDLREWVDDALGLGAALIAYEALIGPNGNGETLLNPSRDKGCLAETIYDWQPQSAEDWRVQRADGSTYGGAFFTRDGNGNPADPNNPINLKYADCDGDGIINYYRNWDPILTPDFTEVLDPTDHDIIVYQSRQGVANNDNAPAKLQNPADTLLRIRTSNIVYDNGDTVVFIVELGSASEPVENVRQVAFVGEGTFGVHRRPSISLQFSRLAQNAYDQMVAYPFRFDSSSTAKNTVATDSFAYYTAITNAPEDTLGVDFAGEEVCRAVCRVTVAGIQETTPGSRVLSGSVNGVRVGAADSLGIPVTFRIGEAGIALADNTILHAQSNEVTIYIRENPTLHANLLLEGPYDPSTGWMRDKLRTNNQIPATEPFSQLDGYDFPHEEMRGLRMTDSSAVLAVTGQEAIVDWVFIEVRDANLPDSLITTRPALLTRHGELVDMNGVSAPRLWNIPKGEYHVAIRHRNHIGARTALPVQLDDNGPTVNFAQNSAYANGTKLLASGVYALYAGDANGDCTIDALDRGKAWNDRNLTGYHLSDSNLDGIVDALDRGIVWNNRNVMFCDF